MKINPILSKRFLGVSVNEILGIICAVTTAEIAVQAFNIGNAWIKWGFWLVMWIVGIFIYTVFIALIKTYITKEE